MLYVKNRMAFDIFCWSFKYCWFCIWFMHRILCIISQEIQRSTNPQYLFPMMHCQIIVCLLGYADQSSTHICYLDWWWNDHWEGTTKWRVYHQRWPDIHREKPYLCYWAFDLMLLGGYSVLERDLYQRLQLLTSAVLYPIQKVFCFSCWLIGFRSIHKMISFLFILSWSLCTTFAQVSLFGKMYGDCSILMH